MLEFDAGVVCCEVRVSLGVICMAVLLPSSDLIVALGIHHRGIEAWLLLALFGACLGDVRPILLARAQ